MPASDATGVGPSIRITLSSTDGPRIEDRRPQAFRALIGRPVEEALSAVPLLLPICGAAQHAAAARAIDAAQGRTPPTSLERWRELGLCAEQAASIAWRLSIDWPGMLGEPPDLSAVKAVRDAAKPLVAAARAGMADASPRRDDAVLSMIDAVAGSLGGLAAPAQSDDLDLLLSALKDDRSVVAAVLTRAAGAPSSLGVHDGRFIAPEALAALAAPVLRGPTNGSSASVAPAIEVGPLAMSDDPLVDAARQRFGAGVFARLLACARAALSWRDAARRCAVEAARTAPSSMDGSRTGLGAAMTARGPVLHWIALDGPADTPRIAEWRSIAPTDWHFAANGPVLSTFRSCAALDLKQSDAALAAASYDPCAPCVVETADHA